MTSTKTKKAALAANDSKETRLRTAARPTTCSRAKVQIEGDSPLLMHRFDEKAMKIMLQAQMGASRSKQKAPRVPIEQAVRALHTFEPIADVLALIPQSVLDWGPEDALETQALSFLDGVRFGFPADAFKAAMVRAGKSQGLVMTDLRTQLFVRTAPDHPTLVDVKTPQPPTMQADYVEIGKGGSNRTADVRFRCSLSPWSVELVIDFHSAKLTEDLIVGLLSDAGAFVGVGEWRSQRGGSYGAFHVSGIEVVR